MLEGGLHAMRFEQGVIEFLGLIELVGADRGVTQADHVSSSALFLWGYSAAIWLRLSKASPTPPAPSQLPLVAPLEYSVARCSKKLACSTPFKISTSQGRGWALRWRYPAWVCSNQPKTGVSFS